MLRILHKKNGPRQKKTFSLQRAQTMDQSIKTETFFYHFSGSSMIEKTSDHHDCNVEDKAAFTTALYLFERNSIAASAGKILQKYFCHPEPDGDPQAAPTLSQNVCLQKKILRTTEDAVILHSVAGKADAYFTDARRIIHGPGGPLTERPYLILFRKESDRQVEEIVKGLLKDHPGEFPDPDDSYTAPILCGGIYYDKRIRWITI